jgi:hypothetical protein
MHFVKKVKYLGDFKLRLTFNGNEVKVVDLKPHLEGDIFRPLKNVNYFKKVKVNPDIETIVWANGADLCPDFLYEIGVAESASLKRKSS